MPEFICLIISRTNSLWTFLGTVTCAFSDVWLSIEVLIDIGVMKCLKISEIIIPFDFNIVCSNFISAQVFDFANTEDIFQTQSRVL